MLIKIYSIIYFLSYLHRILAYNCVPDDKDFTKGCQITATRDYNYKEFFPVEKQPNGDILLRFYIKAETDGHILFTDNSEPLGRHYEIIIGAYGNFRSAIRTKKQGENLVPHEEKNILSSTKWRQFWIRISTEGLIEVGKETNGKPFLTWKDPNPYGINFYSFSCWNGFGASYIHQCASPSYNKYNSEKLKCDLISIYDQRIPPPEAVNSVIQIDITASYADWDTSNGIFQLVGTAKVTWQDSRLTWEPSELYQLQSLDLSNDPIWRPDITLSNAVFDNNKPFASGQTTVSHEGIVSWITPFSLQAKCSLSGAKSGSSDTAKCPINLTINTFGSEVHIIGATQTKTPSPWTVNDAQALTLKKIDNNSLSHSVSIEVPLKRNTANNPNSIPGSKCVVFSGVEIDKPYLI